MNYSNHKIAETADILKNRFDSLENKSDILKAVELKSLFDELKVLPLDQKAIFGKELNMLKQELSSLVRSTVQEKSKPKLDITAPYAPNTKDKPKALSVDNGSMHPIMTEIDYMLDIFYRMGFSALESVELDDDYHMFEVLNFPEGHPARDDYDTFMTIQKDGHGRPLVAPAHTSTMQNRVLKDNKQSLEAGSAISFVIPGRVFRNEDVDPTHEHTFYQLEGVYVDKNVTVGNLIATLKTFLETYFNKSLEFKTNPFYFPFTEPSFEFAISCPFCDRSGCKVCSYSGFIELLGCGLIHPNVLKYADIDPNIYSGFAWGGGIDRLVMIKNNIEDVRHFESGRLDFLGQFK